MNKMTAWMKGLLLLTLMVGGQVGAEVETVTYLHTDHLGSPIMGRDASGNTVFREEYGPWGQQLNATTPSDDVTYTGHANESDIGLTYMKARWYDPAVGRFLSPDPVTFDGGGAGHLERYTYVQNNPYSNVDPDGRDTISVGLAAGLGLDAKGVLPSITPYIGGELSVAVSFPTPWDPGANFDVGLNVTESGGGGVVGGKGKGGIALGKITGTLTLSKGSVLDQEGSGSSSSVNIVAAGLHHNTDNEGNTTGFGASFGPGIGAGSHSTNTNTFSLRRGVSKAVSNAIDSASGRVQRLVDDIVNPMPKLGN